MRKMPKWILNLSTALLLGLLSLPIWANERVALVIGNAAYAEKPLANPVNDATAIAKALKEAGFDVTLQTNLDIESLEKVVAAYLNRLGPTTESIFYFAGHGLQHDKEPYLVPLGAGITESLQIPRKAFSLRQMLAEMEKRKTRLNVLLIDACRDNPYSRLRSESRGLARIAAGTAGTFIMYAAGEGGAAADGSGQHGLFTDALLRRMQTSGRWPLELMLKQVAADVYQSSGQKQLPTVMESSLLGDFCIQQCDSGLLMGAGDNTTPNPAVTATLQAPLPAAANLSPIAKLLKAAVAGDGDAQVKLGRKYFFGDRVTQSDTEAVKWFRRAAEQGNSGGQAALGALYLEGRGVAQSDTEAVKWFRRAAEQDNSSGQAGLGALYSEGRGVAQNDTEAVKWSRLAAEQGHAGGQISLGVMYARGQGVDQSGAEAVKWFRRAVEQGHAGGQVSLGLMYARGQGVDQSDTEAVKWFRRAVEQGNDDGQYNLGVMYLEGRGVDQSDTEAAKWFRRAAEHGHEDGQYNLGVMYLEGRGVDQSDTDAVKWLRLAAKQGHKGAQNILRAINP